MSSFDSTKASLSSILSDICAGKIQLPDFQRGWVWDDDHIRDLLVSISRSFPVGAVMFLETGGEVRFQTRPVEGLEKKLNGGVQPEKLILDGQQRLTTLTQALSLTEPVDTRTSKDKKIKRHYYFDINKALDAPYDLADAIIAVDEKKQLKTNFGRDVVLDLSTQELECKQLCFPCDQVMNSNRWEYTLHKVAPEHIAKYFDFREKILESFRNYQLPVIQLSRQTSKEAVCLVFEKVNTGGVKLTVFELITASYAADGYNLRDDWFGSSIRNVESRQKRIAEDPMLTSLEAPDFLQAVTLLHTHELRLSDIVAGKIDKQVRPVSVKRADVLQLPLSAWQKYADSIEKGFQLAGRFLRKESFYHRRELPYSTQIIPLAAVMAQLDNRWLEPRIYDKLSRWFWCGVLGELYGGAVESRMANDYEELLAWFEDDRAIPRTVRDATFHPDRFYTLRSRLSAAYKGLNVLFLRQGAQDWFWKAGIKELESDNISLDIHHIFPQVWCQQQGIPKEQYDCILNKTPISFKANRKIGGDPPSSYLQRIQNEEQVQLSDEDMDSLLTSHALNPTLLRNDDFEAFIEDRRIRLSKLIEGVTGKAVSQVAEGGEYEYRDELEESMG